MKTKETIINFIKKYKVESMAVFVVSFIVAYLIDLHEIKLKSLWYEPLSIFFFIILGSFLIDKLFIIYEDVIKKKIEMRYAISDNEKGKNIFNVIKVVSYVVVVILSYLFYRFSLYFMTIFKVVKQQYNAYAVDRTIITMKNYSLIIIYVVLVSFILYFVIKEKKIDIKNYLLKIFINFLFVFLIECVVLVGILILYLICEALLGTIPYYIISRIIAFTISIVSLMGFLVGIETVKGENSLFSKILVRYIMQIMVFIGFLIFYIYLMKIIVKHELPSNQVFTVCTTLFSIGLFTSLMSLSISDESAYSKAIKYLPIAFLPALILQIISIGLRINQHGLTMRRYFCIAVIIFEIIYLIYYFLDEILKNEKVKLKNIFLIFNILMLIVFFIPKISVYEFPKIYNSVFKKHIELKIDVDKNNNGNNKIWRTTKFNITDVDIKGYNKLKKWRINVVYEREEKKYFSYETAIASKDRKEYDNKEIDITNIVNNLLKNIKKAENNGYSSEDVFMNIENEIVTGNNKMIIDYIGLMYDKDIMTIVDLQLGGFLCSF